MLFKWRNIRASFDFSSISPKPDISVKPGRKRVAFVSASRHRFSWFWARPVSWRWSRRKLDHRPHFQSLHRLRKTYFTVDYSKNVSKCVYHLYWVAKLQLHKKALTNTRKIESKSFTRSGRFWQLHNIFGVHSIGLFFKDFHVRSVDLFPFVGNDLPDLSEIPTGMLNLESELIFLNLYFK